MAVRQLSNDEIARLAERFGLSVVNNDKGQPRAIEVPRRILSQYDAEVERLKNSPPPLPEEYAMEDRIGQSTLHSDPVSLRMDIDPGESSSPDRSFLDTAIPMAIRIAPAVAGAAVGSFGGIPGMMAGGLAGGAAGEKWAQDYEIPGENDTNWNQVAVQGALNAIPFGRMGNIPGVRQASARLAETGIGRILGRSASASTPAQRVVRELPRTAAVAAGRGAVIGAASGTPTRMAAGQPTTIGDIGRDIGYGAAIGGSLPVAGRAAIESKNLGGWAARNKVIDQTLKAGATSLGGYVGYRSGGTYGAATGAMAGYASAQAILNKMKKWGLPSTEKGTAKLYKLSPEKIQADIESITDDISKIEHLSVDLHAKELKKFASGVAYIRANGLTVSTKTNDQLARINDLMLTPKANTALRSMAAPEFLNEDKLIDISKFTNKEVSKYHNDLAEAIDAASRAGREIPEKWRQAFEGLRERIHRDSSRDYSSAIERLMKSALVDRKSFDAAFKSLPAKMQGEIRGKDSTLLDILKRRSENVGGRLAGQASESTGLLEILEDMRRPVNVELPGPASHGGFTIPSDASARIKRAENLVALIEKHKGARLIPRESATWKEELQSLVESFKEPGIVNSRNASAIKILRSHPDSAPPTIPSGVEYNYKPRSGAATPSTIRTQSGDIGDVVEEIGSTVEDRSRARGVTPEVASIKILKPDEIRELLSNRPGLEAVIQSQKLVGKSRLLDASGNPSPQFRHFERLYKDLTGESPTLPKHYSPAHVAGLYWAGGMNSADRMLDKRIAIQILNSSDMGNKKSIDELVSVIKSIG
jgi:hypothetical protein|tara:strand:- start:184 stop:2637 length:2454 start_codon:yes stop_codon:yes gene_type:complete